MVYDILFHIGRRRGKKKLSKKELIHFKSSFKDYTEVLQDLQRYIYFQLFFKHPVEISQANKVSIKFHGLILIIQFALVVLRPKLLKSSMEKINFQFTCQ